jgi:GTP cyclohydrolase I
MDRPRAERAIEELLRALGRDPDKEPELRETKARVAEAFIDRLCVGYTEDARAVLAAHAIDDVRGEVIVRAIPVMTTCPHHLTLATGTATVGYLATGRGVGIGAIADVVRICSRRLVLQEALGDDVCSAIWDALSPGWVFCRVTLSHGCMRIADDSLAHTTVETLATRGDVPRDLLGRREGDEP